MYVIELALGLIAIAGYVLVRWSSHPRVLMADSIFTGISMYFIGAWTEARNLDYVVGAESVLHISLLALVSASVSGLVLRAAFAGVPAEMPVTRQLSPHFLRASGWFTVVFNLVFSLFVFRVLLNGNLSTLFDERGLLVIRKMISTGEKGYFYPGLVKQVRDMLGPTLIVCLMGFTLPRQYRVLTIAVGLSTLFAMFLGGQRGPLMALGWAVYLGWRLASGGQRRQPLWRKVRALSLVLIALPVLAIVNAMLGRTAEGASTFGVVAETLGGLFERLFLTVPQANIESFAFIESRDFGFAQLWLADLLILAPGTQSGLSNELHSYLGGSYEGNAVLGLPVNSYVNAGYIGVLVTPFLYMLAATLIDRKTLAMNDPLVTSARYVLLVYLLFAYDPYLFLLNGGLFLLFCIGLATVRSSRLHGR